MWTDFFIFGTVWFWIMFVITIGIITFFIETSFFSRDSGGGAAATITMLLFFTIYFFAGSNQHIESMLNWLKTNSTTAIFYLLGYYAIGVVWSIVKWYIYLKYRAHEIMQSLKYTLNLDVKAPEAGDHKSKIISWMSYWPFSAFWTIVNKFFLRIWEFMYMQFENVYNKISKNAFANVVAEAEKQKLKNETEKRNH